MEIVSIKIALVNSEDKKYNTKEVCQCCGNPVEPIKQANGISYYYTVNDRVITPSHAGAWIGKLGEDITRDPHPHWLHAVINSK